MSEKWIDAGSASNIVGFWDGEGILTFSPQSKFQFPSKKFRDRMTRVVVGKLLTDANLINKDGDEVAGKEGDTVGVWFSPGMAELLNLGFVPVRMKRDESLDKDTGKGQPMKGYKIQFQGTPRKLPNAPRFSSADWEDASDKPNSVASDAQTSFSDSEIPF